MKKPISLWIIQIFILASIIILMLFFIRKYPYLLELYSSDIPEYIKVKTYLFSFIRLLILTVQILAIYFSFKRNKHARLFTILGWLPIFIGLLWAHISDGITSSDAFFNYDSIGEKIGGGVTNYVISGMYIWLTSILLFSNKVKCYFKFY